MTTYVLNVFQNKATPGIKTSKREIYLIQGRLKNEGDVAVKSKSWRLSAEARFTISSSEVRMSSSLSQSLR